MQIETKGIILKSIHYSESSLIISVFTQSSGLVQFIVKGGRQLKKNSNPHIYSVGQEVYLHFTFHEHRNLQYITHAAIIGGDVAEIEEITNRCIYFFCIEVVRNLLLLGQPNESLFTLLKETKRTLSSQKESSFANYPLYFLLQVCDINGYSIQNNYSNLNPYLDLMNGCFINIPFSYQNAYSSEHCGVLSQLLNFNNYDDFILFSISNADRRMLIDILLQFLQIHIPNFKALKSLPVLISILS